MQCWRGEDREDRLKKMSIHTLEWVWFPVRSCTTSAQLWGRPGRPPSGSFHLYPPDTLVPVSLQKLSKDKTNTKIEIWLWTRHNDWYSPGEYCYNATLLKHPKFGKHWFTFAFLLLFWHLLHPLQQTPQICDAVHKGDLLILIWPGVLQDFPHIDIWGVILLFWLPSGAGYEGTMWG